MQPNTPPTGWRYPRRLRDLRQPTTRDAALDSQFGGLDESLKKIEHIGDIERAETRRAAFSEREDLRREYQQRQKLTKQLEEEIRSAPVSPSIMMALFYTIAGLLAVAAEVSIVYQIVPIISFAERGLFRWVTAVAVCVAPSILLKASLSTKVRAI